MGYAIGIDVGERSVGFSAVDYDDDGWPIEILCSVSHIHDGGMDPDTGKSPKSRLATAGVARRTRRLVRNRRKRLKLLDEALRKHGFPVPDGELPQTHDAWLARAALVEEVISDPGARDALISLAVRHIARHRGWRNPWWSYERLTEAQTPSDAFAKTLDEARDKYGDRLDGVATMGQLVSRLAGRGMPVRPTNKGKEHPLGSVMSHQVRQEDSLAELRLILDHQRISASTTEAICRAVFHQEKPRIPKDRIGTCTLQRDQRRAPTASMEFQEYRIRTAVANLRVGRDKRALTPDEHDRAVAFLMSWREDIKPRWRDLAEHLGYSPRELVDSSIDGSGASSAPHDRTSLTVEAMPKKSKVRGWWSTATPVERAELITLVTDLSGDDPDPSTESLALLLDDDATLEELDKLNSALETGRAAYSQDTLAKLNAVMREQRCDVHTARKTAFNIDDDWQPPRPSFDDFIEHPTVARVNTLVRRFLMTAVTKWGMPDRIVVEHVRDAFAGPTALAEIRSEIRLNTFKREGVAKSLREQGIENVTRQTIKRNECVERQNCICLYCGSTITLLTAELDHILPRTGGGSSRRDNLVAVCRSCNSAKGKLPFPVFAERAKNTEISLDAAKLRVKGWQRMGMSNKSFARLKADVIRRLSLTEDDDVDERSLESTAYAAREMRARIETFLDQQAARLDVPRGEVMVFSGTITSEARKAGGVDDRIRLRSFTRKSRFDRRHHAVDATVITTLNLMVARTLKERALLQRDNRDTGKDPEWKDYRGSTPAAQTAFAEWAERIQVLAGLLETAIHDDKIPVVRQLRLSPRVGAVHAETIEPLVRKSVGEAFSQSEILRIVNRSLFMKMSELAAGGDLDEDPGRGVALKWPYDRPVELFPSNAAYLPVRGGAAAIGGTVNSAQVYAWRTRVGFGYGMLRLFAGEFPRVGFRKETDVLAAMPPVWSQAARVAQPSLRARIASGETRRIGWIAVDDEIEIDPPHFMHGTSKIAEFLRVTPETHWVITGFFAADKISIAPAYLAYEGVTTSEDAGRSRTAPTPAAVADVLKANRIPLSLNVVFESSGCSIIRRTITGAPRWRDDSGLPVSWNVREAAERAFAE